MNLIWTNSSRSGLCDRLLDIFLMSTYSRILNYNLFFTWHEISSNDFGWQEYRFQDYKLENLRNYFELPQNIKINQTPVGKIDYFNDYLGGVYSPLLFYKKYLKNICDYNTFLKEFKISMSEFKPKENLLKLVSNFPKPTIGLHLRREDKVRMNNDTGSVNFDEIDFLNEKTFEAIDKLNYNSIIYIASDSKIEKQKFKSLYKNNIDDDIECEEYVKTYIDLYMLSQSEYIIMSQKHSNFSTFASFMNFNKIVYLYDNNCMTIEFEFNKMENFILYKNL